MSVAATHHAETLERKAVERWFRARGVPHLMLRYSGRDRVPVLLCWLFLVMAFEIGAAPWLQMSAVRLLVAPLVFLVLAPLIAPALVALLTTSTRPSRAVWMLPAAIWTLWMVVTALSPESVPDAWSSMWVDFPLVFGVLLTSAVLFRTEAWQLNPTPRAWRRRRALLAWIVGSLVVFSLEGSLVPGFDEPLNAAFAGVLPAGAQLSPEVAALPVVAIILWLAVGLARDAWHDRRPALSDREAAALVPVVPLLVLLLGVETAVLPNAAREGWIQATPVVPMVLLLALACVLWRTRMPVCAEPRKPGPRDAIFVSRFAVGAWLTLYLLAYPVLVLLFFQIDVFDEGLGGAGGFALALGIDQPALPGPHVVRRELRPRHHRRMGGARGVARTRQHPRRARARPPVARRLRGVPPVRR